jgi:hypothetical protein
LSSIARQRPPPRAAAVFVNEFDAGLFESGADGLSSIRNNFAEVVRNAAYDLMLSKMADVSKAAKAVKPFAYGDALDAAAPLL